MYDVSNPEVRVLAHVVQYIGFDVASNPNNGCMLTNAGVKILNRVTQNRARLNAMV